MTRILETEVFVTWLKGLKDARAKAKILVRIQRLAAGNPGDVKPVGGSLSEMRIPEGPGYRVYYGTRGEEFIVILAGGDKGTQDEDIKQAQELWADYKASIDESEDEKD
jgi:putative addiction module killer protein